MIVGMCTVRNEGDLLLQTLQHAAHHFDLILVVDVCSWDETPAVIAEATETLPGVVSLGRLTEPMLAEHIRPEIWARFTPYLPSDTWWGFVDADEFVEGDVRAVVVAAERAGADYIEGDSALFSYTQEEAAAWHRGEETLADRKRPIHERRTRYRMTAYSERLFKQHPELRWPRGRSAPLGLIRPASARLPFRHYQYRDYEQLKVRWQTRRELPVTPDFARIHYHWFRDSPDAFIDRDPKGLQIWSPGAPLIPDPSLPGVYVPGWWKRRARLRERRRLAMTPQPPATLFAHIDARAIVERARPPARS